jgi:hypothetical protein
MQVSVLGMWRKTIGGDKDNPDKLSLPRVRDPSISAACEGHRNRVRRAARMKWAVAFFDQKTFAHVRAGDAIN